MLSGADRFEPEAAASRSRSERSVAALLSDLTSETAMLLRQEIALLKAELQEKFGRLGRGAGALAAGGLIAFSGWLALIAAAVLGLCNVVEPWLAALIVGLVVLALGAGLLLFGRTRLGPDALVPRRTLNSLRQDGALIRDQLS
jgi:Putative Actinobacterial Holin-X, holin superfamily III